MKAGLASALVLALVVSLGAPAADSSSSQPYGGKKCAKKKSAAAAAKRCKKKKKRVTQPVPPAPLLQFVPAVKNLETQPNTFDHKFTITISNAGTGDSGALHLIATGPGAGDYSWSVQCTSGPDVGVPAGSSCPVEVTFGAGGFGDRGATLFAYGTNGGEASAQITAKRYPGP